MTGFAKVEANFGGRVPVRAQSGQVAEGTSNVPGRDQRTTSSKAS
ncbi:hypothetical protein [Rubellimicrobium rubrum]|nr:hypothetical protein [Rubellimicrobium rubrum]